MNLKLETEFSKAPILQDVDALKRQIDDMRPLPEDVEGRVMQKLRLDWNYHSNAIEGNKLSYGETVAFLMEGITAKGKPLKDHLDIRGHNEAINFLLSIVKDTRPISEADIRSLHKMILVEPYDVKAKTPDGLPTKKRIAIGEYKTLSNSVETSTGEIHYYASPEETPAKMRELMEWYGKVIDNKEIHPVVVAALFHHKFVSIHPFDDGNGRLSRILMNLILMRKGHPPVVIKKGDNSYYGFLNRADKGDSWPFIEYISDGLTSSLQLFLKAAKGGEIDEDDDIDKELALFKIELQSKTTDRKKAELSDRFRVAVNDILPIVNVIVKKSAVLNDLFYQNKNSLGVDYVGVADQMNYASGVTIGKENPYEFLNVLSGTQVKLTAIRLKIELIEFKNHKSTFSVTGNLNVSFKDYEYELSNHNRELYLTKFYDEKLTQEEGNIVTTTILRDLKNLIEDSIADI